MPTFYADEIAVSGDTSSSVSNLADRTPAAEITNRVSYIDATYTMVGTEVATDVIRLGKLKAGDKVLGAHIVITNDAIAATATLDIGDTEGTDDVDRYVDGADVAAAGLDLGSASAGVGTLAPAALGTDEWVTATFATLVTPVAGKILRILVPYIGA